MTEGKPTGIYCIYCDSDLTVPVFLTLDLHLTFGVTDNDQATLFIRID